MSNLLLLGLLLLPPLNPGEVQPADSKAQKQTSPVKAWMREVQELQNAKSRAAFHRREKLLLQLGQTGQPNALDFLGGVFESEPEWRDEVAVALAEAVKAGQRRERDWRLLLRSLPVLNRKQAPVVYQAMTRFRYKATRSDWSREVILRGTRLDEAGQQAAFRLLKHWTGQQMSAKALEPQEELQRWQQWFHKTYPDSPPAKFPELPPGTRWTIARLERELGKLPQTTSPPPAGKKLFEQAGCAKCHEVKAGSKRFGPFGPGLREVFQRRQQREILEAIVYPSLHLAEEYPTSSVLTTEGKVLNGLMISASETGPVTLLDARGKKHIIPRDQIEEIQSHNTSIMPSGMLEPLTLKEIRTLLVWLKNVRHAQTN